MSKYISNRRFLHQLGPSSEPWSMFPARVGTVRIDDYGYDYDLGPEPRQPRLTVTIFNVERWEDELGPSISIHEATREGWRYARPLGELGDGESFTVGFTATHGVPAIKEERGMNQVRLVKEGVKAETVDPRTFLRGLEFGGVFKFPSGDRYYMKVNAEPHRGFPHGRERVYYVMLANGELYGSEPHARVVPLDQGQAVEVTVR